MAALTDLEKSLNDVFVNKAPKLPEKNRAIIVRCVPYLSLIIGLLTLMSVWSLWHWAHMANRLIDYANDLSRMYGGNTVATSRMSLTVWLALLVLLLEAILFLAAYQPTKEHKKSGWDLLFYAALVNLAYGLISSLTAYDGFGSFVGALISSAIGLYFLFQIRSAYTEGTSVSAKKAAPNTPVSKK